MERTFDVMQTGKPIDSLLDAIFKARRAVIVSGGGRPNTMKVASDVYEHLMTARLDLLIGMPPFSPGSFTIWGLAVVHSPEMDAGTFLVSHEHGWEDLLYDGDVQPMRRCRDCGFVEIRPLT